MPPRLALQRHSTNRLSAVYIGPNPQPTSTLHHPDIPDLPEPPSPVGSTGSGLPSPPATNSTGSGNGSTGDSNSIAVRGGRPMSLNGSSSSSGGSIPTGVRGEAFHRRNGSVGSIASSTSTARHDNEQLRPDADYGNSHNDDTEVFGNREEDDGDDTARLDRRQNDSVLALQRVRSLTERNRMVSFLAFDFGFLLNSFPGP
jgi:hypothetical protein